MLVKLFKGELSLGSTFWKFGILGLIILHYTLKMFASLLRSHLDQKTIYEFFMHHFHIVYSSKMSVWWALCYMSTFVVMVVYSYKIVIAVWRCAASYDKSIWLAQLARLGILLAVFLVWYPMVLR